MTLTDYKKQELIRSFKPHFIGHINDFNKNKPLSYCYIPIHNQLAKQINQLYRSNQSTTSQEIDFKIVTTTKPTNSELDTEINSASLSEMELSVSTVSEFEIISIFKSDEEQNQIISFLTDEFNQMDGHKFHLKPSKNGIAVTIEWNWNITDASYTIETALQSSLDRLAINGDIIKISNSHYKIKFTTPIVDEQEINSIYKKYDADFKDFIENKIPYDEIKKLINEKMISKIRTNQPLEILFDARNHERDFRFKLNNDGSMELNLSKLYTIDLHNNSQIFQYKSKLEEIMSPSTFIYIENKESLLIREQFESAYIQQFLATLQDLITTIGKRLLVDCHFNLYYRRLVVTFSEQ